MVDLTRDQDGCLHARLLDAVVGRSGTAYKTWLQNQPDGFTADVEQAALDPFRGYANAIRDELPDAVAVLDAFHVVRLATQVVDEVRRRVQQDTLGHRGHKNDPLYQIRGLLRHGVEHLSERQQAKLTRCLEAGDPDGEVNLAWQCYQQLRSIYHSSAAQGRQIAEKVIASFPTCPIPEVARLGRTLKAWRQQVLAYFDTAGVSNGFSYVKLAALIMRRLLPIRPVWCRPRQRQGQALRVGLRPSLDPGSGRHCLALAGSSRYQKVKPADWSIDPRGRDSLVSGQVTEHGAGQASFEAARASGVDMPSAFFFS